MTKHTEEMLCLYISNILSGQKSMIPSELEQADKSKFETLVYEMLNQINEAEAFFLQLAQGNLNYSAPKHNIFLNAAKDLQASLRHLLWQAERVALGDYSNKVEFLGDFSKAFNLFIGQVALRESYQKKAAGLEKRNLEQSNRILAERLEQQLAHYEDLKRVYQKINKVKHDLKNHFLVLDDFLSRNDIKGTQEYLHSFMSDILRANGKIYDTKNPIFDALLTEKYAKAVQVGISFDTDITIKPDIKMDNVDWCILFGNAVDNAIEACQLLEHTDKKIIMKVQSRKTLLNIVIKNTALPPVESPEGFYKTSKKDKLNHGLGLSNIADVVEKYAGVMETMYQDGYFTLTCMLCDV